MNLRSALLAELAADLAQRTFAGRSLLVAIDGLDGVGKTTFADDLADALRAGSTDTVRVSIDGFHRPSHERYRRGRASPLGFFEDSYDYEAFDRLVVSPARRAGTGEIRPAIFDVRSDEPVDPPLVRVPAAGVVLVDGIFLHRDELAGVWDVSIWLRATFRTTMRRLANRDGSDPDPEAETNRRYVEGQQIYLRRCHPTDRATIVIDLEDPDWPFVV